MSATFVPTPEPRVLEIESSNYEVGRGCPVRVGPHRRESLAAPSVRCAPELPKHSQPAHNPARWIHISKNLSFRRIFSALKFQISNLQFFHDLAPHDLAFSSFNFG